MAGHTPPPPACEGYKHVPLPVSCKCPPGRRQPIRTLAAEILLISDTGPTPTNAVTSLLSRTLIPKGPQTPAARGPSSPQENRCVFKNTSQKPPVSGQPGSDHYNTGLRGPSAQGPMVSYSLHGCLQPPLERRRHQRPARACPFSFLFIASSVHSYRPRVSTE